MKNLFLLILSCLMVSLSFAQSGPQGLAINSKAPEFKATDQNGKVISLDELRTHGPVVVLFYRGNWCPYCNRELHALSDSLQYIVAKGARVVAVTPEAQEGIDKTIEKTKATFPILYDKDVKIAKAYDVSYKVEEDMRNKYKDKWNVDFLKINQQQDAAYLPVPAVYIIDKKGTITYRFFETDYTKRPSVRDLLNNLK